MNLEMAKNALKEHYKTSTAMTGIEALDFVKEQSVDLILLDIEMPQMNGIETLMQMKQDDMISNIPIIFLTAISNPDVEAKCLTLGAQDFITKPFFQPAMLQRVQRVLELQALRNDLESQVLQKTRELELLTIQTITTFANAIDAKDPHTKGHSFRVAQYSKLIAQKLGFSELSTKNLYYTALLHDIGKIGIPDYILSKNSALTDDEFTAIKKHPEIGCHILEDVILVPYLGIGAISHHEKVDGTGYPFGKKGEDIPLIGRIISVADAVDAMMSDRSYRKKLPVETVIRELEQHSGTQFDVTIADIMISILQSEANLEADISQSDLQNELLSKIVNEYVNFSNVDGLTGLWNRVYLEDKMDQYLKNAAAECAFLMIDLDNFKQVNDVWGHTAGDSLLTGVSVTIRSMLVPGAIPCRMGGDEFAIFIPGFTKADSADFAAKLLKNINQYMRNIKSPFRITMSVGIAHSPADGCSYEELYRNADKALCYAKNTSKNKYTLFSDLSNKTLGMDWENSVVNIESLKGYLSEKIPQKGAYLVHQEEFKKIYQLLQRMSKRSNEKPQIILFTFSYKDGQVPTEIDLIDKFKYLITATKESLRIGDVATKFGNTQYIILLKNAESGIAEMVAKRIIRQYSKMNSDSAIRLIYEIDELEK